MVKALSIIIGQYGDRSAISEECYGPYEDEHAKEICNELNRGQWMGMVWSLIGVGLLPGELPPTPPPPVPDPWPKHHELFKILEARQGVEDADDEG